MSYSKEQIEALKKYYPNSDYVSLNKYFPDFSKRKIKSIAHYYGVKSNNPGHRIDLTGSEFGKLTVLGIDHITENSRIIWKCKCVCGNECVALGDLLKKGSKKSCGCLSREVNAKSFAVDHTGERFGMLTAIERIPNYMGRGRTYYKCICDCGNEKYVLSSGLVTRKTKTCGCMSRKPKLFKEVFDKEYDDKIKRYLVYKHVAPNGKVYIGITRQDAERRWQNGNGYNTQKKFWRAIQKYGWENIVHEILETDLTEKEACEKEIFYIEKYKSLDSEFGYNVSMGGTTGRTLVNPVMQYYNNIPVNFFESHQHAAELLSVSERTVKNYILGNSVIEGYHFEEMPSIHTYDIDSSLYDIRSKEHLGVRKIMLEQRRKNVAARNKTCARAVCQYDLEGHFIQKFNSIKEAQNNIKGLGSIMAALKGKAKSAGGFQWRYDSGDYFDIIAIPVNGRPVLQIDPNTYTLIGEYYSLAEAERKTGISKKQIFKSCKRLHNTSGGYVWRYKDDAEAFVPIEKSRATIKNRIPINQYSKEGHYIRSYSSITEAEKLNPEIVNIRAVVNSKEINKSAGGFMWVIDNGNHEDIKPYHANGKWVEQIDVESGLVIKKYPSIRLAQNETGINNIAAACKGAKNTAGGYRWKYSDE